MHAPDSRQASLIAAAALFFSDVRYCAVGDGIMRKRPHFRILFKAVDVLSHTSLGNALLLSVVILGYRPLRRPGDAHLFQYGDSENNVRVFRRANEAASHPEWSAAINGRPLSAARRFAVLSRMRALWKMARVLTDGRAITPFVHTQLTLTAAAQLVYSGEDFRHVRCVCVASDHSPLVMGLLDVARQNGIRTCYIQHAPVADYFPPLDYDLSILFDRSSIATYANAAARRGATSSGKTVILPPFDTEAITPSAERPPYRLGLCLSYLFNEPKLEALLDELTRHPAVRTVSLRRHPRCKADLSKFDGDRVSEAVCDSLADFSDICDIVLVPNSGVSIELLHLGKPVFYTPDIDHIGNDYYGFVRAGIIPEFRSDRLDDPNAIASFFDEGWRERYKVFDETISTSLAVSQASAGEAFRSLVER